MCLDRHSASEFQLVFNAHLLGQMASIQTWNYTLCATRFLKVSHCY